MNQLNESKKENFQFVSQLNDHKLSVDNREKEVMLYKKIEFIENQLKRREILFLRKFSNLKQSKLRNFINRKFHMDLKLIDELFIRADYLDSKSANLLMDEIDDRVSQLIYDLNDSCSSQAEIK